MSVHIAGMGWVTPLGSGVEEVWSRLLNGESASAETLSSPLGRDYPIFRVPASATARAPAHPRLRRSSAISRFAAVAGLDALESAGVKLDPEIAQRTALIFAVSNGGVIYTKRFYHEIVESGAQAASPLLFPETVFNAPASHLAAILGITGATYTLVGDGAVGTLALKMAEDVMTSDTLDYCLVVGAEEADWLLCDAYQKWRLLRSAPPVEPFQQPPRGTIISEGAGAILLARSGPVQIEKIASGTNFRKQREAAAGVDAVFSELCAKPPDHRSGGTGRDRKTFPESKDLFRKRTARRERGREQPMANHLRSAGFDQSTRPRVLHASPPAERRRFDLRAKSASRGTSPHYRRSRRLGGCFAFATALPFGSFASRDA